MACKCARTTASVMGRGPCANYRGTEVDRKAAEAGRAAKSQVSEENWQAMLQPDTFLLTNYIT